MNVKKIASCVMVCATMAAAQVAMAADSGTIDFTGKISDNTCDVKVNGGTADASITLPTVSAATLAASGDTTGRVFVRMDLSNCALVSSGTTPATGDVRAFWQASPNINPSGRLINTLATAAATNVEIEMLNDDLVAIDLSKGEGQQNSSEATITAGTAQLVHYAQYHAIGQSTPGGVTSEVEYVISYI